MMATKKLSACILLAAVIFVTACEKEKMIAPQPAPETPRQLVKMSYPGIPTGVNNFKYDAKGRLIEQGADFPVAIFDYTNNIFSAMIFDHTKYQYDKWSNGKIDNAGRIIQFDGLYTPKNGPAKDRKYTFTYNADGYVVKQTFTEPATNYESVDIFTYSNNNLIAIHSSVNGQPAYRIEYDYYDNLPNKLSLDLNHDILGHVTDGLTGKRSKNLVKTRKIFSTQNVNTLHVEYQFQLDSQGYPLKYKSLSVLNNQPLEMDFTYNK